MKQIARNVTIDDCGALRDCRYLLHDRDTKFARSFRAIIVSGRIEPLSLPARSPNLNAYAERWVRSVKEECLSKVILIGEQSLRRALSNYVDHFHTERNHQGKGNVRLFPRVTDRQREGPVRCRERLGGLLRFTIERRREPRRSVQFFDHTGFGPLVSPAGVPPCPDCRNQVGHDTPDGNE
jgi:putative transposase